MNGSSSSSSLSLTENEHALAEMMDIAKSLELNVTNVSDFDPTGPYQGIKAITYEGLPLSGRRTKVFAYMGLPKNASEEHPAPAVVLVHGGGGHPFLEWMNLWLNRGYATIAFETTGYFPTALNAGDSETSSAWIHDFPAPFAEAGFAVQPDNDGMKYSSLPLDQQWMYHALADTLLASRILAAQPQVDPTKLGIMGISWGGVITSLALTYYPYAFAMPIYGSGYLDEALSYMGKYFSGEATQSFWLAQHRFSEARMPIFWQGWNADNNFSINSLSKSYLDTVKNNDKTCLSIVNNMLHSHSIAWGREEPFYFADTVCFGKVPLPRFALSANEGDSISWPLDFDEEAFPSLTAKAYYLTSPLQYDDASTIAVSFKSVRFEISDHVVQGSLPPEAVAFYLEAKGDLSGMTGIISTPLVNL